MAEYAIITGAARGIGKAIAKELAAKGYSLLLTAEKDEAGLLESADAAKKEAAGFLKKDAYFDVRTFLFDVGDPDAVRTFYGEISSLNILNRVSVLVNNAGIDKFNLLQDISDEEWRRIMAVNIDGAFYMCRGLVPSLIKKQSGCVVNISSYWAQAGSATESAYCASKGALNSFTLALSKELSPSGIRVNAVSCEYVDTEMNKGLSEKETAQALKAMPSRKIFSPEEVALRVGEICDKSCAACGQIISV